jgi:hypothetical protein
MHAALVEVNGNIEVGQMCIAPFVKEDIIRFEISATYCSRSVFDGRMIRSYGPMHDMRIMEVSEGRR